ncbi:MAG: hypothetical protein WD468_11620 [Pirellulales bacterium]
MHRHPSMHRMRIKQAVCGCVAALGILTFASCSGSAAKAPAVSNKLRDEAIAKLREVRDTQESWVKVHAAEWLVELGYPQGVADAFRAELEAHGNDPEYRIGILRVLAKESQYRREHASWIDKIKRVFLEEGSPDRAHAAETMAKLRVSLEPDELKAVNKAADSADVRLASYCRWLLAEADGDDRHVHLDRLCDLLDSPAVESRRIAAYALRSFRPLETDHWRRVVDRAESESDPFVKLRLRGTALITAPTTAEKSELEGIRSELSQARASGDITLDQEMVRTLIEVGKSSDLPVLERYLRADVPEKQALTASSATADLSAAAADAILRIDRRSKLHRIHWLDWTVIAGYSLLMIGIGLFYSLRTKDREDYLLGGRVLRPWMVGFSLFATLLSTISYLAYPGELIRYGPFVLCGVFAFPVIYLIVGWWLIPSLRAIPGASGYALLEERLGSGVRLLAASVFLLLRFIWMATILYATVTVALLPALDIDPAYTPLLCAIMGIVTLGYTSLGGLRAVVLTDVIQSFILFGGAMIAVILVTIHFGGLQWFPTSWPSHWRTPNYGLGFQGRITVGNAMIFMLAWYVCTCGSDQMAIQRFKATRDIAAARQSFGVSLISAFAVKAMLGLVGLAVMAYFLDQPDKLPDRITVFSNADQLFPRFIVIGIPIGLTGLVISGVMAAAMSSLSSGISAATSVISDDFIKRFRGLPADERASLMEERCISAAIGALAVALSLGVGYVPGNLFEITNRLVNALVAPLFILFFMAIFVPWSNATGAVVGFVVSAAVAIAIAMFRIMDISMMWIIPTSMIAGIIAGCIASLIPGGKRLK